MRILLAASEMAPFVRTGGLADAMSDFAAELGRLGHNVSIVLPFYRVVRENKAIKAKKSRMRFTVDLGTGRIPCEIYESKASDGARVYFVSHDEFFDRSGLYGVEGRDYQDNAARFVYFTKCVLELAQKLDPVPQILHANSWQTALLPVFVREQRLPFHTVLTPHTLEYQGNFWSYDFALTNLPGDYFSARGVEYYGSMNCLKGGILFADAVVLAGERQVSAALAPEFGCGLENVLREHQHKLYGIFSHAEVQGWKCAAEERKQGRAAMIAAADLTVSEGDFTVATVAESCGGKGIDLLLGALDRLVAAGARMILLGPAGPENTVAVEVARRKHAGRFAYLSQYDEKLSRNVLRGADLFLVPGPVEARAIWLRRAMLSGAIPVAAGCPGLFQLVRDWEQARDEDNGFVFHALSVDGLVDGCRKAFKVLRDPGRRDAIRSRCMGADFSSEATARAHAALYERVAGSSAPARAA